MVDQPRSGGVAICFLVGCSDKGLDGCTVNRGMIVFVQALLLILIILLEIAMSFCGLIELET